jgi:hypothetical protein
LADPARPIVVVSHDVWDLEAVYAIGQWLAVRGVRNPLFLRIAASKADTALTRALAHDLNQLSRGKYDPFQVLSELPLTPRPLGIGLSGPPGDEYEDGGILWSSTPRRVRR